MPTFDSFECQECGETFKALGAANAAEGGYCSPACETDGKDL